MIDVYEGNIVLLFRCQFKLKLNKFNIWTVVRCLKLREYYDDDKQAFALGALREDLQSNLKLVSLCNTNSPTTTLLPKT